MNAARRTALLDGISYAALTVLVWGVNAFRRGLWQDDVVELGEAFKRSTRPFWAEFAPDASPLRRLAVLPSSLANATPEPIWTLHLLCGGVWLAHGLLIGWIVGLLLPGRRWTRFVVICLTLTATSDYTTGSIVALAYNVAALLLLAAVGYALVWINRGGRLALVTSSLLLACSLLTMDVALPAVPFLLGLFVWIGGRTDRRRVAALLVAWAIVLAPIAIVEWSFLRDPASYAAMALLHQSNRAFVTRTMALWIENFAPWRWAFVRPVWYVRPGAVIPMVWMVLGSVSAVVLFLVRVRGRKDHGRDDGHHRLWLSALFATMALVANAAYADVWFSDIHYRTHILSRVWASVALGLLLGWIVSQRPRLGWAAYGVGIMFVFFGVWGGIERQDLFLGTWQRNQRELVSILQAAPALRPGTVVLLRGADASGRYLATEADYLTKHWMRLLYNDWTLRTMRLNSVRGSGCQPAASGPNDLDCWLEGQASCFANKTCEPARFRLDELVVMDYDSRTGTYHLVDSLRGDPLALGRDLEAARYRPENRIVAQPWTSRQLRLLLMESETER